MDLSSRVQLFMKARALKPALSLLLTLTVFPPGAAAQQTAASQNAQGVCWQNVATGKPFPNENLVPNGTTQNVGDPDHATSIILDPGQTVVNRYARGADGSWVNTSTGQPFPNENLVPNGTTQNVGDPDHATSIILDPGQTVVNRYARGADGSWVNTSTGQPFPNENLVPNGTTQNVGDPDHATSIILDPGQTVVNRYVKVPCPAPPATTTPPPTPPTPPEENKRVAFQLRGFGGATIVNGNSPSTAGFDGAVLFPLGNRVLVGPTAGFQ